MGLVTSSSGDNGSVWDKLCKEVPDVRTTKNIDRLEQFQTIESLTFLDYAFLEQVSPP